MIGAYNNSRMLCIRFGSFAFKRLKVSTLSQIRRLISVLLKSRFPSAEICMYDAYLWNAIRGIGSRGAAKEGAITPRGAGLNSVVEAEDDR